MEMEVIDTCLACWLCSLGSVSWQIRFLYCFLRKVLLDLAHCFQVILAIGRLFDIILREREREAVKMSVNISLFCSST